VRSQANIVAIYRNRRTGHYRIQPFGRLPNGSAQPFGEQQPLAADVGDQELLNCIIANLKKTSLQVYVADISPKIDDEEWHRQLKEEQLIEIEASRSEFRLIPSKKIQNSFGSIDDMISTIPADEFQASGGKIIKGLFSQIP
jgi:hypothetical protein